MTWIMPTLHIAPNDSAGQGIAAALADSGVDGDGVVLTADDDLSCGPIDPAGLMWRRSWWDSNYHGLVHWNSPVDDLWTRLDATSEEAHPVVWVGRHSAQELAFYLSFAARMTFRAWSVVDVTGLRFSEEAVGANARASEGMRPVRSVAELTPAQIRPLLDTQRRVSPSECEQLARRWRTLQTENASLRVVTDDGLASVPVDYFDESLLDHLRAVATPMAWVIADTMAAQLFPVRDYVLHQRLLTLIEAGHIAAAGDPMLMGSCQIWAPPR
jgi:hypothetical protein